MEKKIPSNLGGQFATLGANVPAFINILTSMFSHLLVTWGQTTSQKCSKLAPSFFLALTPSVKWAPKVTTKKKKKNIGKKQTKENTENTTKFISKQKKKNIEKTTKFISKQTKKTLKKPQSLSQNKQKKH
jgi:hypothetical protein